MTYAGIVLGIDPSLRGLAVAYNTPSGPMHLERFSSASSGNDVHARMLRCDKLVSEVTHLYSAAQPGLVVIEGYAYSQHAQGGNALIELGGILRHRLRILGARIVELAPNQLKLFATGDGRADKRAIARELKLRYGRTFDSHDEADAFVCMQAGLCLLDLREPCTWFEREVIDKLRGRTPAKRPKAPKQREMSV